MWRSWVVVLMLGACGGDDGVMHLPDARPIPDAPPDAPACPPLGAGTMHAGSVTAAETWTAAGSPWMLPFDTSINAAVTIEPCAVVRIGGDKSLTVRANASLTAMGTADRPVTIERLDASNSWSAINALNGGTLSFAYTTITGGGDRLNSLPAIAAAVDVAGTAPAISPVIHADHLTITGSESNGISLHDGGSFDGASHDVAITGSATSPIVTSSRAAGTIPAGTYTGNTQDAIVLTATGGNEAIGDAVTFHARGVPYIVGIADNATLDVYALTGVATLTIEAGVTLKFHPGSIMRIDPASATGAATGALIARGTAAAPIVFTSLATTPAPGDWYGIWFGDVPSPTSVMDHTRVEYAGFTPSGTSGDACVPNGQVGPNDAAIRMIGGEPATVFITNTEIVSSARHGIDRGYRSNTKPSFVPTNTFTNVAGCKETYPRDSNGACPASPPCP